MKNKAILLPLALAASLTLAGCTALATSPLDPTSAARESSVTVRISGGLQTDAADNGRPIVLVAGMLGVPPEVFRQAFSGVTPAAAGAEPDPAQVLLNKAALLKVLAPYGITNDQLDAASNEYRYLQSAGQTWPHTAATATATVVNGTVTKITVTSAGAGYTSSPTITLSNGQTATATLSYGSDPATNGSISAITVG